MPLSLLSIVAALLLPALCFAQTQPQLLSARAANRILDQATWGPTPASSAALQTQGFDAWFAAQVAAPISTYSDQPLSNSAGKTNTNLAPVQVQFFQNALNGPDQLRQRVAFALSEIWVVSELELNNASAFPPLMRLFQNDALGNYETLMRDVTLNPAMGRFLNMVNNAKGSTVKGTSANENYARESMQLFTIGLTQLNPDGSPVLDGNGNTIPTYIAADVTNLAKAFTGWTYGTPPGVPGKANNPAFYLVPMVPSESEHDLTAKTILGVNFAAGRTAEEDLTDALHTLFMQSSLAPFISQQLIEHLVTSNPSPAYISRVSEVFANNGSGVRGDLTAVVRAILTDPEARAGDVPGVTDGAAFGHMREPVLFIANLIRGLNATLSSTSGVANAATNLGQQLFYAPSVFSYFSPQYRTTLGLLGPEFQIYSTQTASNRADTVNSAVYGGQLDAGTKFDLTTYTAAAANNTALIALINTNFFHEDMSSSVQNAIDQALAPLTAPADKAKAALYIALTSSEYQIIH